MAKYIVADPDGVKHVIQGPDGASPDDVIRQAQAVIPYKPTAGINGRNMTNPQPVAQSPQGGQQAPFNGLNPFIQLVLSRMGIQVPDPQKQAQAQADLAYTQALTKKANEPQAQRPEYVADGKSPSGTDLVLDKFSGKIIDTGVKSKDEKSDLDTYRDEARQDRLEKEYGDRLQRVVGSRSGGLGLQDQKVDQAIHLRSMINQSWNPQTKTYEIPEMQQGELVIGLANLMSGSSVSNMEQLRSVTPKTASGDMAHMVSYWTGQPITNQPQAMIKNLVSSIDRQGKVSEKLRDKYMNGLKMLRPKDLDKDRADAIASTSLTSSYDDILKDSPDQQGTGSVQPYSDPQKEARYQEYLRSRNASPQ